MDNENLPSLDELMAQSERVEQSLLAERRKREQRVITAQDDWGLVEVGVNGDGEVVEVAINTALLDKAGPTELAEAMLEAARAAQQRSKALRR